VKREVQTIPGLVAVMALGLVLGALSRILSAQRMAQISGLLARVLL
jgi:hypothetical protein